MDQLQKATVILGAGASFDVAHPEAVRAPDLRPPLAAEIFGARAYGNAFWPIMQTYPEVKLLQQLLYRKTADREFNLESELRRYADSDVVEYQQAFMRVPAYIRDLLYRLTTIFGLTPRFTFFHPFFEPTTTLAFGFCR